MKKSIFSLFVMLILAACADDEKSPTILSIEPNVGKYHDVVTITGSDFDTDPNNLIVTFNGKHADIVSVTSSTIVVKVPVGATKGKVGVISNDKIVESASDFTVTVGEWKQKATAATRAGQDDNAEVFTINGKAYVLFGQYSTNNYVEYSSLWLFGEETATWTAKTHYSLTASLSGTASFGSESGKGYVLEVNGPLHQYDAATDTWTDKEDPYDAGNAGVNLIAGFNVGNNGFVLMANNDLLLYNSESNTWSKKTSFPGVIQNNAGRAMVIGTKVYVLTGTSLYAYDQPTDKWTQKADLTSEYQSAFTVNGKVYAGDYLHDGRATYEYNPATNQWLQEAPFGGSARKSPVSISINGRGFVGLGVDNHSDERVKDVYEFLPY